MTVPIYRTFNLFSLLTDKRPVFPKEAVIAAVVVVVLTILFGILARKDKIFKVWNALVS